MTTLEIHRAAHPTRTAGQVVRAVLEGLSAFLITLLEWQERARQRRQLLTLSDRAAKDLCVSRADIEAEAKTPFWRS